jgi:hypothetical protein
MSFKSYWYFPIQLETARTVGVAASETEYFPIKKVILFFEEYNERPPKDNVRRNNKQFRRRDEVINYPLYTIGKEIRISKEDFDFLSGEKDLYFVVE